MKTVLTIAGSDCSGGAGVQADLKTMAAHGVFGMSVIVSVVAENTARVIDIQDISPRMIEEQIDAVFEDIVPDAVKIGMLSSPECMKAVAGKLAQYKPAHIVIDPVMFAKNGDPLMDPASVGTLIETVLPFAEVLTPNVPEAQYLADMEIRTPEDTPQLRHDRVDEGAMLGNVADFGCRGSRVRRSLTPLLLGVTVRGRCGLVDQGAEGEGRGSRLHAHGDGVGDEDQANPGCLDAARR